MASASGFNRKSVRLHQSCICSFFLVLAPLTHFSLLPENHVFSCPAVDEQVCWAGPLTAPPSGNWGVRVCVCVCEWFWRGSIRQCVRECVCVCVCVCVGGEGGTPCCWLTRSLLLMELVAFSSLSIFSLGVRCEPVREWIYANEWKCSCVCVCVYECVCLCVSVVCVRAAGLREIADMWLLIKQHGAHLCHLCFHFFLLMFVVCSSLTGAADSIRIYCLTLVTGLKHKRLTSTCSRSQVGYLFHFPSSTT